MELIKLQQKISALEADFIVIREQLESYSTTCENEDESSKARHYVNISTQIDFIKNNIEYLKTILNKNDDKPVKPLCSSCIERSASLEELETIYKQAPIGLCVYDTSCNYLRANQALASYSGLQSADQLIGKSAREIVPGIADDIEYHVSHVFQTGAPIIDVEVSGDIHSFPHSRLNSFHPLFYPGTTHVKSVAVVVKDITELKKHEISLLQQKKQVEEANHAKSSFLSHVSHELRTPMNCILGMIKFILDSDLTIDQFECASAAYQSAASMLSLLNDLLDLSKIEAGKFQAAHIPFQLLSEIEKVVDTFAYKLGEKRLHLYTHYDMNLPNMFIGDPGRIRQIVLNLVGNAIKFTEEGHITLTVRSSKENEVVIEVEDTGCGIPSDQIALIFREFEQGEVIKRLGRRRNSDVTHRSTGLGLAITEQFVKAMRGRIEVQSKVSQGSKFSIFLPLRAAQSERVGKLLSKKQRHLEHKNIHIISKNDLLVDSLTRSLIQIADVNIAHSKSIDDLTSSKMPDLVYLDTNYENWLLTKPSVVSLYPNTSVVLLASLIEQRQILPTLEGLPNVATTLKPIKFHSLIELSSTLLDPTLYRDGAIKRTEKLLMSPTSRRDLFSQDSKYPGLKVLIAEDNKINQIILERLLRSRDCQVDIAVNGSQAVELASTNKYDVIFMDCEMPVKDGYTATKEIRERESVNKFSPVKIVAVTAHAMSTDKDKCLESGMDSYMVKPIDTNELDEILQAYSNNCK